MVLGHINDTSRDLWRFQVQRPGKGCGTPAVLDKHKAVRLVPSSEF
jgi:hypothetical protein